MLLDVGADLMAVLSVTVAHAEHVTIVLGHGLEAWRQDVAVLVDLARIHWNVADACRESVLGHRILANIEVHDLFLGRRIVRIRLLLELRFATGDHLVHGRQVNSLDLIRPIILLVAVYLARLRARALQFLLSILRAAESLLLGRGGLRSTLLLAAAGSDTARASLRHSKVGLLRLRTLVGERLLALELSVLFNMCIVELLCRLRSGEVLHCLVSLTRCHAFLHSHDILLVRLAQLTLIMFAPLLIFLAQTSLPLEARLQELVHIVNFARLATL